MLTHTLPILGFGALLASCTQSVPTSAERFVQTGELVALSGAAAGASNACFTCHGLEGRGNGAGSPRLAGLNSGYIERQLIAYADGRRKHPQMEWIARQLDPTDRHLVAAYYARMPMLRQVAPPAVRLTLYHRGDPARGLPACASCHGDAGQGIGPANPPVAGQPAAYLAEQLERWRHGQRRSDPGDEMLRISQLLTPAEGRALAAYAAQLPGSPPSPGYPEAFPGGRRADPRNDVSGPPLHVPESARATE